MSKLGLIIKREYLTRVKKKSFILLTILTPLGIGLLMFVSGYLASGAMNKAKQAVIKDESGVLAQHPVKSSKFDFTLSQEPLDSLKENYIRNGYDLFVHVPALDSLGQRDVDVKFYAKEKLSFTSIESIERKLGKSIKDYKIRNSTIDKEVLASLETDVTLENGLISEKDDKVKGDSSSKLSAGISGALAYGMGFLMYMVIFIFGGMVMRSVMEEKINRIVEVMISSVKPFQLMLGKVLGVGMVGLTQMLIWIILIPIIMFAVSAFIGIDTSSALTPESAEMAAEVQKQLEGGDKLSNVLKEIMAMNWWLIIPGFIIYFLGGYFIYSSLFAAVGSAIGDDLGEGQQMMMPIVLPVIMALMMMITVLDSPNGTMAVFGSMFPLFSPIIMPARLPFDPPMWQVIVSVVILIASVVFFIWLAARIYRVGIFMYGKKVSFKELGKWLFYKG